MTRNIRLAGLTLGVGLACMAFAAPVRADDWNQLTLVTFNRPVELPGIALGSGTYRFEVPDTNNRQLVRVTNQAGTQVYGTFMTAPVYRNDPANATFITFKESAQRNPAPVREWFYPGHHNGHLFLYQTTAVKPVKAGTLRAVQRPAAARKAIATS